MHVWTIQPPDVLKILEKEGKFTCNPELSDKDFTKAYEWMVNQMDAKGIEHPENLKLPIWAWYRYDWKNKKPDLRHSMGVKGMNYICIELEVPDSHVLLSDYNAWHYVLNDMWNDPSKNEEEYDALQDWYDGLDVDTKNKTKIESWQRIFDIEPYEDMWNMKGRYVQATFWEITEDMVKKVQTFISK